MIEEKYKKIYSLVHEIISLEDPAGLGGAVDEYENQINQIVRIVLEKESIDVETLSQIFSDDFPGCSLSSQEEFKIIAEKINRR
jgi:hypothetical protein